MAYLAILNSELFSELLAASSSSMAGGQWNLSTRYVQNIPLPKLSDYGSNSDVVPRLAKIGQAISEQGVNVAEERFRAEYAEAVRAVYGMGQAV